MKRIVSFASLALLLLGGVALGNEKKQATFGALEALSAAEAQTKVTAWLKEVGKSDQATTQKLTTIWKDENRSILDRVGDSLALGNGDAAKIMAEIRDPNAPAPVVLNKVFKDEANSSFFRANLALIYARSLTNRKVYEEALDTLAIFGADQVVDPAAYLFHRAVCEHAMLRKPEATKTIMRLLEEGHAISPDRYKTVSTLMLLDMHTWKDKDLGDIARKMDNIGRRLDIARGGPETQRQEREVLNRLDEMIKKLENKNKSDKKKKPGDAKDGPPSDNDGQCPGGECDKPGNGDGNPTTKPSKNPLQDAKDPNGTSTGAVDHKKFQKLVESWGSLPPREQQRALQDITSGMPARHREAIENYFKSLNNTSLKR